LSWGGIVAGFYDRDMKHQPTVYGIPNCGSVKTARAWMDEHGIAYTFHDFKKQGVPPEALDAWLQRVGWEILLNRKGTTWRQLEASVQARVTDAASARALMLTHASVIKRPVVVVGNETMVGVNPEAWARVLA
jgi:Spx/MgsR family transcriptional regulator